MKCWLGASLVSAAVVVLNGAGCSGKGTDPCATPDAGTSGDYWCPMSSVGALGAVYAQLLWTGEDLVAVGATAPAQWAGARYDPLTDTWSPMSMVGFSPGGLLWTGTEVLSVGGSGARYDPVADSWSPLSPAPPGQGANGIAVWTGTEVLTFGCEPAADGLVGSRYDLATDTWTAMSTAGAPGQTTGPAMGCGFLTAAWTGSEAIIVNCGSENSWFDGLLGEIGHYDPATDTWTPVLMPDCPWYGYTSVWTGEQMILWGQRWPLSYDSETMLSMPISTAGAPYSTNAGGEPFTCPAVWTGSLMVVWGSGCDPTSGGRYDPTSDTWTPMSSDGAPAPTSTIVWAGTQMVVWGGPGYGGRYTP